MKFLCLAVCVAFFLVSCTEPQDRPIERPMDGWAVSTPHDEGLDEGRLVAFDGRLANEFGNIDSMLVIRNGRIVYEKHYKRDYSDLNDELGQEPGLYNYHDPDWHPYYQRGELHTMQSVTKSVTSALIGIAIGRGEIAGLDVPVLDFLDDYEIADLDEWKRSMTLRDLLTMKAGIAWDEDTLPYTDPANSCAGMESSDDWIQFVIDQPMSCQPGTVFNYNSGASLLLSQIIRKSTGKHVDEYAEEHLFGPLGITNYAWKKTPTGHPDTEGGLVPHRSGSGKDRCALPDGRRMGPGSSTAGGLGSCIGRAERFGYGLDRSGIRLPVVAGSLGPRSRFRCVRGDRIRGPADVRGTGAEPDSCVHRVEHR